MSDWVAAVVAHQDWTPGRYLMPSGVQRTLSAVVSVLHIRGAAPPRTWVISASNVDAMTGVAHARQGTDSVEAWRVGEQLQQGDVLVPKGRGTPVLVTTSMAGSWFDDSFVVLRSNEMSLGPGLWSWLASGRGEHARRGVRMQDIQHPDELHDLTHILPDDPVRRDGLPASDVSVWRVGQPGSNWAGAWREAQASTGPFLRDIAKVRVGAGRRPLMRAVESVDAFPVFDRNDLGATRERPRWWCPAGPMGPTTSCSIGLGRIGPPRLIEPRPGHVLHDTFIRIELKDVQVMGALVGFLRSWEGQSWLVWGASSLAGIPRISVADLVSRRLPEDWDAPRPTRSLAERLDDLADNAQ